MKRIGLLSLCTLAALASISVAADWTRFRGPGGLATSDATDLPASWSATENVVWKTRLPGAGTSSPVTLGDRIYITCYSGYALNVEDPGNMNDLMRHVVCLDRQTGKILWEKEIQPELPESAYSGGNNTWHGYASSTPTTDGERLYVFFGKSGVYCLDLEGKEVWHASVGSNATGWGSGNSPILYKNLLIVNAAVESGSLVALDKPTGKEIWKTRVGGGARNTPILVDVPDGQTELVFSLPEKIAAYDPDSGDELWHANGIPDRGYVCPSVVANNGIVYVIGGRKNTAIAIRAGGRGDVTGTHELWRADKGSNVSSPVYHDGNLYWIHERSGVANCLNAQTGETVYQERLDPRPGIVYSSVIAADGKLYCPSQHNGTYVLAASPQFELLAHNTFADDDSRTNAGIVVSDGRLLLRNDVHIYCIGKK